ncbi:MAG: hypothetical protein DRP82_07475 [Planctomycetota bacterium]|nr:MAG: hypothetical protein DRP82_07475 [Planctomycetota bacterium]
MSTTHSRLTSLDPNTGEITGTLTQATPSGGVTVTIKVRDANNKTAQKVLTLVIHPELQITTTTLPEGKSASNTVLPFMQRNGTQPYKWYDVNGTLATYGLSLNTSTGVVMWWRRLRFGVWAESPNVAIAADSNGNPAIVYVSGERILYAAKRNNVWQTTDPGSSNTNGDGLALFFNSDDNPVILYSQDDGLECVWFDGSTWKNHTYDSGNACDAWAAVTNGNTLYCFYNVDGVGLRLLEMDMSAPANGSTETALTGVTAEQIAASFDPSTGKLFASYFSQDQMSVFFVSSSGGT